MYNFPKLKQKIFLESSNQEYFDDGESVQVDEDSRLIKVVEEFRELCYQQIKRDDQPEVKELKQKAFLEKLAKKYRIEVVTPNLNYLLLDKKERSDEGNTKI